MKIWGARGNLLGDIRKTGRDENYVVSNSKQQPAGRVTSLGTYDNNNRKISSTPMPDFLLGNRKK